jgi:hypothetical protein
MVVTLAGEPALKGRDLLVICDGFVDDRVPTHSFILARGGRSLSLGTDRRTERALEAGKEYVWDPPRRRLARPPPGAAAGRWVARLRAVRTEKR